MAQTRYIHFRVTNDQFQTIKSNASIEGFKTVSNYLRDLALHRSPMVQEKIGRMHEWTKQTLEIAKKMSEQHGR